MSTIIIQGLRQPRLITQGYYVGVSEQMDRLVLQLNYNRLGLQADYTRQIVQENYGRLVIKSPKDD